MKSALMVFVFFAAILVPRSATAQFEHERHAPLFDSCEQCHPGASAEEQAVLPQPALCAGCHNDQIRPRVAWTPVQRVSTMRFTHDAHPRIECQNCHNAPGAAAMEVQPASPDQCFACHDEGGSSHDGAATTVCATCHTPRADAARPTSHGPDWNDLHGREASAAPDSCAACHIRQDCLDCHRPDPAGWSGYHPPTFLTEHPVAAYARQTSCADCHNVAQFCSSCHQQAGLGAPQNRELRRGFHDANAAFFAGHGPAARQSLESCVSCHTEQDCLSCHAALGGRRINPHGPGFDADKLRERNAQVCTVCHGAAVPGNDK